MRLAFMGTPEFAVPTLDALVAAGHDVVAVYTQPPRPANRGKKLTPSAVQARAEELGLEVRTPVSLRNAEAQAEFAALNLDAAVVAAYGLILPHAILDAPKLGCINIHASLLPRWRGAAPIQRAILEGDVETGVMLMQMDAGLDTGAILAEARAKIDGANAGQLTERLARMGAVLLMDFLELAQIGTVKGMPQPIHRIEPTYAKKVDKAETRLDFSISAEEAERRVRAFNPSPGAWFEFEGDRYRVLEAEAVKSSPERGGGAREARDGGGLRPATSLEAESPLHHQPAAGGPPPRAGEDLKPGLVLDNNLTISCATGAIRPTLIQRAGKPAMATADLLRGKPIPPGTILA